jgi:hypothetical protein
MEGRISFSYREKRRFGEFKVNLYCTGKLGELKNGCEVKNISNHISGDCRDFDSQIANRFGAYRNYFIKLMGT